MFKTEQKLTMPVGAARPTLQSATAPCCSQRPTNRSSSSRTALHHHHLSQATSLSSSIIHDVCWLLLTKSLNAARLRATALTVTFVNLPPYARRASAVYATAFWRSVRLSVRHTASKRLNILSNFFHR